MRGAPKRPGTRCGVYPLRNLIFRCCAASKPGWKAFYPRVGTGADGHCLGPTYRVVLPALAGRHARHVERFSGTSGPSGLRVYAGRGQPVWTEETHRSLGPCGGHHGRCRRSEVAGKNAQAGSHCAIEGSESCQGDQAAILLAEYMAKSARCVRVSTESSDCACAKPTLMVTCSPS